MDWQAFGAISNAVLVATLVGVTIYYAIQTNKQANSMQEQIKWDRTYRPRLDAYTRFITIMADPEHNHVGYFMNVILPQLRVTQPFSSNEVRVIIKTLLEKDIYRKTQFKNNNAAIQKTDSAKVDFPGFYFELDSLDLLNNELRPIIEREIEEITKEQPSP